jgi:hypothetical protein
MLLKRLPEPQARHKKEDVLSREEFRIVQKHRFPRIFGSERENLSLTPLRKPFSAYNPTGHGYF